MPVLDRPAGFAGSLVYQPSFSWPPQAQPGAPFAGKAAGVVRDVDGELIAIDASGDPVALRPGDPVAPGDVLITRLGGHALIDLSGGASLAMSGPGRAEVRLADEGRAHVVAHDGAFVLAAATGTGGEAGTLTIETGAAIVTLEGGALAFRYGLENGLSGRLVTAAEAATAVVRIVNDSGIHIVDAANPAFAVAQWSEPPDLLSGAAAAGEPGWLPPDLLDEAALDGAAVPAAAAMLDEGDPSPGSDVDGGPAFETGAGSAEDGDPTFVFASPSSALRGLADQAVAAAPVPALASEPAIAAPPARAVSSAPGHNIDALFLWQPPVEAQLPPPPPGQPAPHLRGWEPTGRSWDTEGYAWVSGGEREWPAHPHRPLLEIQPIEGESMAALKAVGSSRAALERFLGLQHDELNGLIDGVAAQDGSAMRTSIVLRAGQTLVLDVLFDADENLTSNDFAAFTVAHGGIGEAFVLSSIATTGDFGMSPWQTLRYTAGASGTFTIGFVVVNDYLVNDGMPAGLSLLYVDGMRSSLDASDLHRIAGRSDALGGSFELFAPKSDDGGHSEARLIAGFESLIDPAALIGRVSIAGQFTEPDGCRSVYSPTEGASMAVLYARGGTRTSLENFLALEKAPGALTALPLDADGSPPSFGGATKLSVAVAAGDRISFDWMFDAGDRLPDNDFAVFTVSGDGGSRVFKLADVRATGEAGASGWRTSVYTATGDEELTIGFAVVNDWMMSGPPDDPKNSRLLVDNVWLNRDFADGYQLADLAEPGDLATLPMG